MSGQKFACPSTEVVYSLYFQILKNLYVKKDIGDINLSLPHNWFETDKELHNDLLFFK